MKKLILGAILGSTAVVSVTAQADTDYKIGLETTQINTDSINNFNHNAFLKIDTDNDYVLQAKLSKNNYKILGGNAEEDLGIVISGYKRLQMVDKSFILAGAEISLSRGVLSYGNNSTDFNSTSFSIMGGYEYQLDKKTKLNVKYNSAFGTMVYSNANDSSSLSTNSSGIELGIEYKITRKVEADINYFNGRSNLENYKDLKYDGFRVGVAYIF